MIPLLLFFLSAPSFASTASSFGEELCRTASLSFPALEKLAEERWLAELESDEDRRSDAIDAYRRKAGLAYRRLVAAAGFSDVDGEVARNTFYGNAMRDGRRFELVVTPQAVRVDRASTLCRAR